MVLDGMNSFVSIPIRVLIAEDSEVCLSSSSRTYHCFKIMVSYLAMIHSFRCLAVPHAILQCL